MMGDTIGQVYEGAVIVAAAVGVPLLAYIARSIQRVNIALFGLRGDNGVVGSVKELEQWRTEHEILHAEDGAN